MENGTMPKITLSISEEAQRILRERAARNYRSISKEVEYIINKIEELGE